jgi:hypothetical protein
LQKAKRKIWRNMPSQQVTPADPPYVATPAERAQWQYPALAWLDDIVTRFPGKTIISFMPIHIRVQPVPGSSEAVKEDECKARIAEIARRHRIPIVDFGIHSEITSTDSNYWDPRHYRLPIAERIVDGLERALATHKDDPAGDWRYIGAVGEETALP